MIVSGRQSTGHGWQRVVIRIHSRLPRFVFLYSMILFLMIQS